MAWTTPGTATAGEVLTAAFWNSNVRDNTADLRSYQNRYARAKRASTSLTINSTTWANVDTALDLTLNASAGDVIEYCVSGIVGTAAVVNGFDVVTVVSGSPVNSFGLDAAAPTTYAALNSASAWYCQTGVEVTISGSIFRTLAAGDISAGTVTLRLRYVSSAAVNRTLFAVAPAALEVWARNHGPVTT